MSPVIRKPTEHNLGDGVYQAMVTTIEDAVASRFTRREDLVRIGFDLVEEVAGQRPRLWLVAAPSLQGRLLSLVEAALCRPLLPEEGDGFELDEILGKEVNVVIARVPGLSDISFSKIVTFLPIRR